MITGAKINFGLYDNSIDEDTNTATESSKSKYADTEKILKNQDVEKVAYLEKDYFFFFCSFIIPTEDQTVNVGWESENLSDENGAVNEFVQFTFSKTHASFGIQIEFPKETIAKDFDIIYFDAEGQEILRTSVRDNEATSYSDYATALDWKTIKIQFSKIANPYQRTRISAVYLGILDTYNEDLLIEISASRNIDLTADNTDSGEISFKMYNSGRFSITSITDLPEGIQHDVKIVAFFKGVDGEYKEFGHYLSKETSVTDDGKIIEIQGYDAVYDLNTTYYEKGIVYLSGRSLKDIAEEVAADAGIEIEVDDAFASIISKGYIPYTTHREALRRIAEAGCGILKIDAKGKIYLKKQTEATKPAITTDDIIDGTLQTIDTEKYLGVNVKNYIYGLGSRVGLAEIQDILLTEEPQTIEVEYASSPADVSSITVEHDADSGIEIVEQHFYSDRARFVVQGPEGNIGWITVLGNVYSVATNLLAVGSTQGNIKVIDNPLIAGTEMAQAVLQHQYNKLVGVYQYNADVITENEYDLEDKTMLNDKEVHITKIQKTVTEDDAKESIIAWEAGKQKNV